MPNKTKVREMLPGIQRRIRDLSGDTNGKTPVFSRLSESLASLWSLTDSLYEPEEDGSYKPLDEDTCKKLLAHYQASLALARQAFSEAGESSPMGKVSGQVITLLDTDLTLFQGELPGNTSLPELAEKRGLGGFAPIELPGSMKPLSGLDMEIPENSVLSSVGGALSKRKLLSYTDKQGQQRKGYYTSGIELDYKKNAALVFLAARRSYPRYSDYLRILEGYYAQDPQYLTGKKLLPGFSEGDLAIMKEDKDFLEMSEALTKDLDSVFFSQKGYFDSFGAEEGGTIEMRNVGMTRMAELMGNEKLLARSVPMRLKQGDRIETGVFMEHADGVDINKILPGHPMESYTEEVYNYGPGLKSLSDIQVLDYICGNVDRHTGNMFYHFREIDGKIRFVGVTGIDNDLSFISKNAKAESFPLQESRHQLESLTCISAEQAAFIRSVDPDQVKQALAGCRLSAGETDAVIERIEALKARIDADDIPVLSDEEWSSMTLSDLESPINIFSLVKTKLIGEPFKNYVANNEQFIKKPGDFTQGEITQFSEELIRTSREQAEHKQAQTEADALAGEQRGIRKIISDRVAMAEDVKTELADRGLAKDPFRQDRLEEIREIMDRLDAAYAKADHLFGGSDEYDRAVSSLRDVQQFMDKAMFGKVEKNVQLMEEAKEEFSCLLAAARALKEKTQGSSRTSQRDRYHFACELENFSRSFIQDINEYDMALLQKQDELLQKQKTELVKEAFVYQDKIFGGRTFDPALDSEVVPYTICKGIDTLADAIYRGSMPDESTAIELTAAVLVNESIRQAIKENSGKAVSITSRKNKAILEYYKKDADVIALAKDLIANPGGFARDLINGNMETIYRQFIQQKAASGTERGFIPQASPERAPAEASVRPREKALF